MKLFIGTLLFTLVFLYSAASQVSVVAQEAAVVEVGVEAQPETDELQSLFNGADLNGWDGDERLWQV